jgi:glutamate synthase domain-containing protein 2
MDADFVRDRLVNFYRAWSDGMRARLFALGLGSIRDLRGRRDLLEFRP